MVKTSRRREPHRSKAVEVARAVFRALGIAHPNEASIETLAFMRGALVTDSEVTGARARLVRVGGRSMISVRAALPTDQRRFAIAHELGHHELHANATSVGVCSDDDMLAAYRANGFEEEANSFAGEFLMPYALVEPICDVKTVSWLPVRRIADEFQVSLTAAALRFVAVCPERVALVASRSKRVEWSWRGNGFFRPIERGRQLDPYTLAVDWWEKGKLPDRGETVSASAWIDGAPDDAELFEHAVPLGQTGVVLSLLWIRPDAPW